MGGTPANGEGEQENLCRLCQRQKGGGSMGEEDQRPHSGSRRNPVGNNE